MEYGFPQPVWLRFYKDKQSKGNGFVYRARLVSHSKEAKECIMHEIEEKEYNYVEVETDGFRYAYTGELDVDAIISGIYNIFEGQMFPLIKAEAYILSSEFLEKVTRYLEAAKILVGKDSEMEDIISARDASYGEEEDIQKCLDTIRSIKKYDKNGSLL